jgi:carbon storage regulator
MLTLTREPGQKIVVGDDIVITVVSVSENGRVRLGIEAPRQIRIDREEVLERIQNENIEAGVAGSASNWAAYAARQANRKAAAVERDTADADSARPRTGRGEALLTQR